MSQMYLGPFIGQVTHVHGVTQRLVGWILMLILAEIVGKFGRVSAMAVTSALVTRLLRRSASLYIWTVGLGYALGGLIFDILFFLPFGKRLQGKTRKFYLVSISVVSGLSVLIPYLFFNMYVLGFEAFIILFIPSFIYSTTKGTVLSVLGTIIGLSSLSRIKPWIEKIRQN
ncbi:MAG: hypothetical protein ACXACB_00180 [Promethearchaeota archaeon]